MTSKKIFVDTGGLIALWMKPEEHHDVAVKVFTEVSVSGIPMYTTDYVIDELLTWARCREKISFDKINTFIKSILVSKINLLKIEKGGFDDALELMGKYTDKYFSFTDCTSFVSMKELKIKDVITTDKHFETLGFRNLLKI